MTLSINKLQVSGPANARGSDAFESTRMDEGGLFVATRNRQRSLRDNDRGILYTAEPCRKTAFADIGLFNGDRRVRFLIETEKVNSFVRLTIHDVREAEGQGPG